jgi:hypothetical protein
MKMPKSNYRKAYAKSVGDGLSLHYNSKPKLSVTVTPVTETSKWRWGDGFSSDVKTNGNGGKKSRHLLDR